MPHIPGEIGAGNSQVPKYVVSWRFCNRSGQYHLITHLIGKDVAKADRSRIVSLKQPEDGKPNYYFAFGKPARANCGEPSLKHYVEVVTATNPRPQNHLLGQFHYVNPLRTQGVLGGPVEANYVGGQEFLINAREKHTVNVPTIEGMSGGAYLRCTVTSSVKCELIGTVHGSNLITPNNVAAPGVARPVLFKGIISDR